jgi:hypothetical protein
LLIFNNKNHEKLDKRKNLFLDSRR